MDRELQKAINLAKKTGDRLIVFDSGRPDNSFVVMSLNEYEKLVVSSSQVRNLTENELLDKINRDIAVWKNEQYLKEQKIRKDKDFFADSNKFNLNERGCSQDNPLRESDYLNVVPDFFASTEDGFEGRKEKSKRQWRIPKDRKEAAEEVIEEDRQYLEEVIY